MPETRVVFYQEDKQSIPVRDWLAHLKEENRGAFVKCAEAVRRLSQFGYHLRRPHADFLRDGIYELRVRHQRVNYRILYFYHGRNVAILAYGLTKEKEVPKVDIERALTRKKRFESDPEKHTYEEDDDG